jgi:hypothetical protein
VRVNGSFNDDDLHRYSQAQLEYENKKKIFFVRKYKMKRINLFFKSS